MILLLTVKGQPVRWLTELPIVSADPTPPITTYEPPTDAPTPGPLPPSPTVSPRVRGGHTATKGQLRTTP